MSVVVEMFFPIMFWINRVTVAKTWIQTFTMGVGGKVQGTLPCCWWKGRTTAGSTGIQGTKPKAGGCGTELWAWCRSYPPRFPFPCAALRMVTNGSPDLCAIRYRPSSNLQKQTKSLRLCHSQKHVVALQWFLHSWKKWWRMKRWQRSWHMCWVSLSNSLIE